jgi:hypothetical protein
MGTTTGSDRQQVRPNATVEEVLETDRVYVTAADFNGSAFDGSPFRCHKTTAIGWLFKAVEAGDIAIAPSDTDYAIWDVKTVQGTVRALPGDIIIYGDDETLRVIEAPEKFRHPCRLPKR